MNDKIPVTVLTGFLGAGKTTLLNRILTENHGQRIAVIENEFGEVGVDQELVINAEEEIFEMNNGCICCTVRGDLIRILGQLLKRRSRFDRIVVETTGIANPGPVAQTFFVDDSVRDQFALDGIVTLVDAKHFALHVDENAEAREQIAFADVIVLNKTDLVGATALDALEHRVRAMNSMARVVRASPNERAGVPMDHLLGIGGFDIARALEYKPGFLEPEYPFEWAGSFELHAGDHDLVLDPGPDPEMNVLVRSASAQDGGDAAKAAEQCLAQFTGDAVELQPGRCIDLNVPTALVLGGAGASFKLAAPAPMRVWLFTQHLPEEFAMRLLDAAGQPLSPVVEKRFVASHTHDDAVGTFSLETERPVIPEKFQAWLSRELQVQGADIYRMKGFVNFQGHDERVVFQGVHMLVDSASLGPWGNRPRRTQLVFIGKHLESGSMIQGFEACLA